MKILDKLAKSKAKNHLCFWPIGWMVAMMNVVKCRNLVHFHCGFSELPFFNDSLILAFLAFVKIKKKTFSAIYIFWFCFLFSCTNFCEITKTSQKLRKKSTSRTLDDDLYSIAVSTSFSQAVTAAKLQQKMIVSV